MQLPCGKSFIRPEVQVSGGKKEAQAQCMLEACRMLDARRMLRNEDRPAGVRSYLNDALQCRLCSTLQDSAAVKAARALEANDFYSSDEDVFFDRTGTVEEKRLKRKKRALAALGKELPDEDEAALKKTPLKYDDLCAQVLLLCFRSIQSQMLIVLQISEIQKFMATTAAHIAHLEKKLNRPDKQDEDADALDSFMSNLSKHDDKARDNCFGVLF